MDGEIRDDLLELGSIGSASRQDCAARCANVDVGTEQAREHKLTLGQDGMKVYGAWRRGLACG
jgi:hypothetical protein